jgi:hypothetical protein
MLADAANASLDRVLSQRDVLWDYIEWEMKRLDLAPEGPDEVCMTRLRVIHAVACGVLYRADGGDTRYHSGDT